MISYERNSPSISFENVRCIQFSNFRSINEVSLLGFVSDLTFPVDYSGIGIMVDISAV